MFAYCNNNPALFTDHTGMLPGYSYIPLSEEIAKFDGNRSTYLPPEEKEYIMNVVRAKIIIASENGGYYKGVWIHKSDSLLPSGSGVSYGMIAIASDVTDYRVVMHEYGHFLHLQDIGLSTYTGAIALPSAVYFWMTELKLYDGDYYSLPWEYIADVYGNVRRDSYDPGAAERAYNYWVNTILFSQTVKDLEGY